MIKEGKFGTFEAVSLFTILLTTKTFYTSIRVVIKETGTAAWYATLISCLTSLIMFLLVYLLMKRFSGRNLIEIFEDVTGKVIGKSLALIFVFYLIYYAGSNLREFLEMIKAYTLPYTPPSIILAAFLVPVVIMAYTGLDVIARVSYLSFFTVIIGLILILVLAYPYYDINNLFPIGGYGIRRTLSTGLFRSSAYSEIVLMAVVINSVHGLKNFKKIGIISLLMSGIVISGSIICELLAFEYTQGSENVSDIFQLSRIIYFSRFFQRIESIFLFIWVIASIVTVAIAFYFSMSIFCKAFKIVNHRPLLPPFVFLTFMVAILPQSLSEVVEINIKFIRQFSVFIVYGIPILVLLIALIFKKKGRKIESENN